MYIRTKDGVYEVKVNKYHELVYCKNNQIVLSCNILNQSENLEELCDEFVIRRIKNDYTFVWNEERNIGFNYFCSLPKIYIVYGAIWTSKGLIYVAKMNEKGELQLL